MGTLRVRHTSTLTLSLFKNFQVTGRQTLQFRIRAFSFINHDLPDLTQGNALNRNFNQNGVNTNTCASTTSGSGTDDRAHYTTGRRVLELALKTAANLLAKPVAKKGMVHTIPFFFLRVRKC
jgi:hypothetical protein